MRGRQGTELQTRTLSKKFNTARRKPGTVHPNPRRMFWRGSGIFHVAVLPPALSTGAQGGRMVLEGTGCLQSSRLLHRLTSSLVFVCFSTSLVMAATVPSVKGFLPSAGWHCLWGLWVKV